MATVLHDAAAHRAQLQDALANIAGTINDAGRIYENDHSRWVIEWDDLASIGSSEIRVLKKDEQARFDTSIFGPALKQSTKNGQATEIKQVLLAKEKDYTDALISIDRDNFLSSPYETIAHDLNLMRSVSAGIYAVNRGLFLAMTPEAAMANVHYYRFMIRHLRSQLYLADLVSESLERLSERTLNLEVVKEKYEATIFTLRRQLDDYHKAHGAVGKNADGQMVANEASGRNALRGMIAAAASAANTLEAVNNGGAAAVLMGLAGPEDTTAAYVVVQLEELGALRSRQRQLADRALEHCRTVMQTTANGFDARRVNFHEENEKRDSHNLPSCYMFKITDPHNAVAFAVELHTELNSSGEWPRQLLELARFGSEPLWRGMRARIGVHYGEASLVESPDGTVVQHFEGVVVDKAMRLASMAACGEALVSKALWEAYQQSLKEGKVPPSKRYQSLRTMATDRVESGRKRGFRKDEYYMRVWTAALQGRKDAKPAAAEVDFGLISFFGLEIGAAVEEESDQPTAEDLLQAKDTEITLLQQELDSLRLAIIKRDSDIEDIRTHMFSHIGQLSAQMNAKSFFHERLASSLEGQLMRAHDTISRCSHITAGMAAAGRRTSRAGSSKPKSRKTSGMWDGGDEEATAEGGGEGTDGGEAADGGESAFGGGGGITIGYVFGDDSGQSLADLDKQRQKEFEAWNKTNGGGGGGFLTADGGDSAGGTALRRTRSNVSSTDAAGGTGQKRHKNHRLWRELNQLITGATVTSKTQPKPRRSVSAGMGGGGGGLGGGGAGSGSNGRDPTVVQKIHSLVRVYGRLLKRFSQQKNEADLDDQSLSEEQFIQLFLKLTNSDTVGSARETFHLCMQTAIENEDVEVANATDDARLMRSVIGHFVKIFLLFRTFKKRAIVDANLFDEEGNLREAAEKVRESAAKPRRGAGGGGGGRSGGGTAGASSKASSSAKASALASSSHGGKAALSASSRAVTPSSSSLNVGAFGSSIRDTSPQLAAMSSSNGATRPAGNVVTPSLGGAQQTVTAKQLEALERQNAALSCDVALRNERLDEAKAKSARDEETIRNLRDELRKGRQEAEQRVRAAVNAAQAGQKDPLLQRETFPTQPNTARRGSGGKERERERTQRRAAADDAGDEAAQSASGLPFRSPLGDSFSSAPPSGAAASTTRAPRSGVGASGQASASASHLSGSGTGRPRPLSRIGGAPDSVHDNAPGSALLHVSSGGSHSQSHNSAQDVFSAGPSRTESPASASASAFASNEVSLRVPLSPRDLVASSHEQSLPRPHHGAGHAYYYGSHVPSPVPAAWCHLELLLQCWRAADPTAGPPSYMYHGWPSHAATYDEAYALHVSSPSPPQDDSGVPSVAAPKPKPSPFAIISSPVQLRVGDDGMEAAAAHSAREAHRSHATSAAPSPRGTAPTDPQSTASGVSATRWSSAAEASGAPANVTGHHSAIGGKGRTTSAPQHGGNNVNSGTAVSPQSQPRHRVGTAGAAPHPLNQYGASAGPMALRGMGMPHAASPSRPATSQGAPSSSAGVSGKALPMPSKELLQPSNTGSTPLRAASRRGSADTRPASRADQNRPSETANGGNSANIGNSVATAAYSAGDGPEEGIDIPTASAAASTSHLQQHYMEVSNRVGSVRSLKERAAQDPSVESPAASSSPPRPASSYAAALELAHATRVEGGDAHRPEPLVVVSSSAHAGGAVGHVGGYNDRTGSAAQPRAVSPDRAAALLASSGLGLRGQMTAAQQQMLRAQQQHALAMLQQQQQASQMDGSSVAGRSLLQSQQGGTTPPKGATLHRRLSGSEGQGSTAAHIRRLPNNLYSYSNTIDGDFSSQQVLGLGIGPAPEVPLAKITGPPDYIQLAAAASGTVVFSTPSYQVVRPQPQALSLRRASDPPSPAALAASQAHAAAINQLRRGVQTVPVLEEERGFGRGELHFAMSRAENERVLAKAAEERRAYDDHQQRLQDQLTELRALQQHSLGLLGGRPKGIPQSVYANIVSSEQSALSPSPQSRKEPCLMEITRITPKVKGRGSISSPAPLSASTGALPNLSPAPAPRVSPKRGSTPSLSPIVEKSRSRKRVDEPKATSTSPATESPDS